MHFPLQFNNGRDVPSKEFDEVRSEIVDQFGGVSWINNVAGDWSNKNVIVHDNHLMLWVDVPDTDSNLRL